MRIHIEQGELARGIGHTLGVVDKRGSLPILSHCLVEANGQGLVISATDLELSFKGIYPAEIEEAGTFAVQAQALNNLVKDLPKGKLEISGDEKQIKLETGESRYKFLTLPADQFPPIPDVEAEGLVELEVKPLIEMIDKVSFSVGDDLQYHLSGIFWERVENEGEARLRLVSSDGHRLSLAERPLSGVERLDMEAGILVPAKAMREIRRFLESYATDGAVQVGVKNKSLCLKAGDKELSVRLLEKKFPDYRRIIPEGFENGFTFNRQELAAAVKRISLLTPERFRGVVFTLADGTAELAHENPEVGTGREVVEVLEKAADLEEPVNIGFNARYLLEALGVMKGEKVVMETNGSDRPARLQDPTDPDASWLVMPMAT